MNKPDLPAEQDQSHEFDLLKAKQSNYVLLTIVLIIVVAALAVFVFWALAIQQLGGK